MGRSGCIVWGVLDADPQPFRPGSGCVLDATGVRCTVYLSSGFMSEGSRPLRATLVPLDTRNPGSVAVPRHRGMVNRPGRCLPTVWVTLPSPLCLWMGGGARFIRWGCAFVVVADSLLRPFPDLSPSGTCFVGPQGPQSLPTVSDNPACPHAFVTVTPPWMIPGSTAYLSQPRTAAVGSVVPGGQVWLVKPCRCCGVSGPSTSMLGTQ